MHATGAQSEVARTAGSHRGWRRYSTNGISHQVRFLYAAHSG